MMRRAVEIGLGVLAIIVALSVVAFISWANAQEEFQAEATALHRVASQYADQHDAHMIALAAIAGSNEADRLDLFGEVARSILQYYPRIVAIDLVPLDAGGLGATTRPAADAVIDQNIAEAAVAGTGLVALGDSPGHYRLIGRSAGGHYAVALEIDAALMLASDRPFWSRPNVRHALALADGTLLAGEPGAPGFAEALGSASQPLVLQASMLPGWADIFPLGPTLGAACGALLLYGLVLWALRQFAEAKRAEARALLSEHQARLAHAGRVNSLGEMASGIAHEITQPLTAILSQAQASRRLAEQGNLVALRPVLEDTITQTKRAAAILERLRAWVKPRQSPPETVWVNAAVHNVKALVAGQAAQQSCEIALALSPQELAVRADPVELEQVLFNLVLNAIEALQPQGGGTIDIATRREGGHVLLEVADTGPGIEPGLRDRLFEPFVTGKPDGSGLGLALCQRLVERMDGEIGLVRSRTGASFRVRLPLVEARP